MQPRDPGVPQETQLESTGNKPELKNPIIDNVEESEAEPAPVEQTTSTKNETGSAPGSENEYVVKGGDTLASISDNLLGSFKHSSRLYELNKDVIKNPNIIFPGQKLKLPAKE
ncbi:MAG: LysM peptidoglycan-binding domain-containing protein [Leptospiraceae bacterium]|nr:LysM peptidoglycan-binding domain-containing protein [Leptospiraceae bacterium]